MNKNTECFELIECELSKIIFENQSDYVVGLIIDDKEIGLTLNSYDGTILTFVDSGCANNPHINTIHQVLLKFMENTGFTLSRVLIEAKYGDIIYCRLHWAHKKQDIYNVVALGDALILHSLTSSPLFISRFVLDQCEDFDSEGYMASYDD
jgi:hypothetical protein